MEKKVLMDYISGMPLSFPYFNMDAFHSIVPSDTRYKATMSVLDPEEASKLGLHQDHVPEILFAQYQAGKYVAMRLTEIGISQVDAAEKSGICKTMLSKYLRGQRPFSPNGEVLTPLCYGILGESCHIVMFGSHGTIHLPLPYGEAAKALLRLPSEDREKLFLEANTQLALYHREYPSNIQGAPRRGISVVVGERIRELLYDKGVTGYELLGKDTPIQFRSFLRQFYVEGAKKEHPRLGQMMYLALETGQALDYFIAEDFTRFTDCYYAEDNTWIKIEARDVLQFIGICAAVTPEQRNKLLGTAIGAALGRDLCRQTGLET